MPILEIVRDHPQSGCADLANGYQLVKRDQLGNLDIFDGEHFQREFGEIPLSRARYADLFVRVQKTRTRKPNSTAKLTNLTRN